jgi:putative DNA primase/helicase
VILAHNPAGVLVHRDELAGLLASMEREGNEGARQFYLSAYSGKEAYTYNRIGRGETRIEACCVAMLGTIQPAVIARHIRDAIETGGGDGLLSRFSLLVWPDMPRQWRDVDRLPDSVARQAVNTLFDRIVDADPATLGAQSNEDGPPCVRFSDEARERFIEWRAELEVRLREPTGEDSPALQAHLAKFRKLVPALALIFHATEGAAGDIDAGSVDRALGWSDLLEAHAKRAYGAAARASGDGAKALLAKLRKGAVGAGGPFRLRDVYRQGWTMLASLQQAERAAEMLADLDYLRADRVETGGRPTTVYQVNPKALR